MSIAYDKYYKTENLFGEPYAELMNFFSRYPFRGKVLDLGCGQGRDAIPIARLGYEVVGIDQSKVGIKQMKLVGEKEKLKLDGQVADIFNFNAFHGFEFVLFDSMFHFQKKEKEKETGLIKRTIKNVKPGCLIVFCIQDTGSKVKILNSSIDFEKRQERITDLSFQYKFKDQESKHESITNYRMIVIKK